MNNNTQTCAEVDEKSRVETDEELLARYYDHADDKYSLAARARKQESVDSGNHDFI